MSKKPTLTTSAGAPVESNETSKTAGARGPVLLTDYQLVEKLAEIGISEKEANVRNKLSRGKFSAAFLLQCLSSIGVGEVRLEF